MLKPEVKDQLLNRFLKYVKINTRSDENSGTTPSSKCQWDLALALVEEMKAIGIQNVSVDDNGYVMGTVPANTTKVCPTIGFIAHMDTSPDFTAKNVAPQIVKAYDGGDIRLNNTVTLSPKEYPELTHYIGNDIVTTNGNTLLGADDKAGIAEILTAVEVLMQSGIEHGMIKIAFTPDEEIGEGADHFDVESFGADFAYTIDGGEIGELEYENFNAAKAVIQIKGSNIHPGTAKNKMKNAIQMAMQFNQLLPPQERPEHTEKYEGFYHLVHFDGTVEEAKMIFIIRDHDLAKFEARKATMERHIAFMNAHYESERFILEMNDQYYNMREKIEPVMHIVDRACKAMEKVGVEPKIKAIRGGTDGARLSYMGLPTPNIFTGGHNFHGKYEYIPVQSMEKAVETIVEIARI